MINKRRALRIELHDCVSDLEARPQKSNDMSSHHRKIQTLKIETYKIKK